MYYAHIRWDDRGAAIASQTVAEHLSGTAALSRAFAEAFGAGDDGELIGLLHDLGKCTDGFQNRLLRDGCALTTQRRAQSPAPNTMAGSRTRPVSRGTTAACRILATCGPIALGTQRFMVG